MGPYREHRRVDAVRRLGVVTKNEASEMSEVDRERRLEKAWDAVAIELREAEKEKRKRPFSELLRKSR